jgi:hypothetical protein
LIEEGKARELCKIPVKGIREELTGRELRENVVWVDRQWVGRPVDMQVGDTVVSEENIMFEGTQVEPLELSSGKQGFVAVRPGIGRFYVDEASWTTFVRVSRKEYTGWCRYRHLEDPEHE